MFSIQFLLGRVGKSATKITPTSRGALCVFQLAVTSNHYWDSKAGEHKSTTTWHKVVCFAESEVSGKLKFLRKFHSGDLVLCVGRPTSRKYKKRDGTETVDVFTDITPLWARVELISYSKSRGDDKQQPGDPTDEMVAESSRESQDENGGSEERQYPFGSGEDEVF